MGIGVLMEIYQIKESEPAPISCWIIQQTHRSVVFQSNKCLLWNLKPIEIRQLVLNGNVSAENWSPIDEAAMYFNYKQLITDWKTIQFSIWCEDRRYQYISTICWIFIQDSILISQIFQLSMWNNKTTQTPIHSSQWSTSSVLAMYSKLVQLSHDKYIIQSQC